MCFYGSLPWLADLSLPYSTLVQVAKSTPDYKDPGCQNNAGMAEWEQLHVLFKSEWDYEARKAVEASRINIQAELRLSWDEVEPILKRAVILRHHNTRQARLPRVEPQPPQLHLGSGNGIDITSVAADPQEDGRIQVADEILGITDITDDLGSYWWLDPEQNDPAQPDDFQENPPHRFFWYTSGTGRPSKGGNGIQKI